VKSLALKSCVGLGQLLAVLALCLFLSSGSFNYWQGWVFLAAFFIPSLAITFYFLKADPKLIQGRLKAGPIAEKQAIQKVIQGLASLFFILSLILGGLDYRFGWSHLPISLVRLGDGLVVLGFFAVFLVFKENSFASSVIRVRQKQKVISTGPYAFLRHPMYSGASLMLFGMPLALGSGWAFIPILFLFAVIVARLLAEEKFLSKKLPGYKAYCRKTPYRLVPYLW
jgi:protein-S-isoprenylcysteine O-methyltransferase Ste14